MKGLGGGCFYDEGGLITETVETSDGNTYEVEATYKSTAGIPMEGTELLVRELLPGDESTMNTSPPALKRWA